MLKEKKVNGVLPLPLRIWLDLEVKLILWYEQGGAFCLLFSI